MDIGGPRWIRSKPKSQGFLSLSLSFPLSQSQSLSRAPPESGLSGENGESKGCLLLVDNSILPPLLWQAALLSPPPIAIEGEGMGVFLPGLPIPYVYSSFGIGVSSFFYFTRCFRRPGNGRQLHLIFHMSCAHIIGRVRIAHKAARQLFTGKWTPVTKLITITLQVCMGLGLRLTRARGSTTIIYILM